MPHLLNKHNLSYLEMIQRHTFRVFTSKVLTINIKTQVRWIKRSILVCRSLWDKGTFSPGLDLNQKMQNGTNISFSDRYFPAPSLSLSETFSRFLGQMSKGIQEMGHHIESWLDFYRNGPATFISSFCPWMLIFLKTRHIDSPLICHFWQLVFNGAS